MMTLSVSVNDTAVSDEIASWADGSEYMLRVRRDRPGQFTALEAYAEPEVEAEPAEEELPAPMPSGSKNPAIAAMMVKGRA